MPVEPLSQSATQEQVPQYTARPAPRLRAADAVETDGRGFPSSYRGQTYYKMPVVKHSHYEWLTVGAFTWESIGGGSQIIATAADLFGNQSDRSLVRIARYLAFAGSVISPTLLISSLHYRRRWYNMLRIFRPTSPMSYGNWSLSSFGIFTGLTAAGQFMEDMGYETAGRAIARVFEIPAALAGGMVCLYKGTELEETSTPLWASAFPLLSPVTAVKGGVDASSALILLSEVTGGLPGTTRRALERFALMAGSAQLMFTLLLDREWRKRPAAVSFQHSLLSSVFRIGVLGIGIITPLAIRAMRAMIGEERRGASIAASAAELAGSVLLTTVALFAGNESGKHPEDYFEYTAPRALPPEERPRNLQRLPSTAERDAQGGKKHLKPRHKTSRSIQWGLGLLAVGAAVLLIKKTMSSEQSHGGEL